MDDGAENYRRLRAAQQKAKTQKSQPSTPQVAVVVQKPERVVTRGVSKASQVVHTRPGRIIRRAADTSSGLPSVTIESSVPSVNGNIMLSILVPTMPGRETKLGVLLAALDRQAAAHPDVEVLVLRDTRKMVIGDKRNRMIKIARGEYVVFVDDDDEVATDYVDALRSELSSRPDLVCFVVLVQGHGPPKPCLYHPSYAHQNLPKEYRRKPNHLMVWRRDLAASVEFPAVKFGEDTAWANDMSNKAVQVVTIDRVLYTYWFDASDNSAKG